MSDIKQESDSPEKFMENLYWYAQGKKSSIIADNEAYENLNKLDIIHYAWTGNIFDATEFMKQKNIENGMIFDAMVYSLFYNLFANWNTDHFFFAENDKVEINETFISYEAIEALNEIFKLPQEKLGIYVKKMIQACKGLVQEKNRLNAQDIKQIKNLLQSLSEEYGLNDQELEEIKLHDTEIDQNSEIQEIGTPEKVLQEKIIDFLVAQRIYKGETNKQAPDLVRIIRTATQREELTKEDCFKMHHLLSFNQNYELTTIKERLKPSNKRQRVR